MAAGKLPAARKRTHQILETAKSGDITSRVIDLALMGLIAASSVAVILESIKSWAIPYRSYFLAFEVFTVGVFTVEYILRLWSCVEREKTQDPLSSRLRYAVTPLAIIDLLAILPSYLSLFLGADLRILRTLRLLRIFKFTRYSAALTLMIAVFRKEAGAFGATLFILLVILVMASTGIYMVERDAQPQAFGSIPAAMWWAVATLTTVGYGDVTPITPLGKFFGACVTITGVGMVALPSGLLASGFSEELRLRRQQYQEEVEETLGKGRITRRDRAKLDKLRQDLGFSEEEAAEILDREAKRLRDGASLRCPHCGEPLSLAADGGVVVEPAAERSPRPDASG